MLENGRQNLVLLSNEGNLSLTSSLFAASQKPPPKNTRNVLETTNTKEPNVPAIIGITACVIVIVLVAVFLAVRRHRKKDQSETSRGNEEVSLNNDYESQGKLQPNGTKEEKPLMEGKPSPQLGRPDRYYQPAPQQLMLRPNFVHGRDSSGDSANYPMQNPQFNGIRRVNYPPEMQMRPPNYMVDPGFIRMVPMPTNTVMMKAPQQLQAQQQQPFVMHAPMPPRSDHS